MRNNLLVIEGLLKSKTLEDTRDQMNFRTFHKVILQTLLPVYAVLFSGCFTVPMTGDYDGPDKRPDSIEKYYSKEGGYGDYVVTTLREDRYFSVKRIVIKSSAGEIVLDYYQRHEPSDDLVFVFPVLGGSKNMIAGYFADYIARNGFDTAIVHRDKDFKKPEMVGQLEEILRKNVVRDRLAIDFFEDNYGKKNFGSFGISRGAINVAMSAGADERLKYNVMALGGTGLARLFTDSTERRIRKYREQVKEERKFETDEAFAEYLQSFLKSTPDNLASFIDGRNVLMFLSLFDDTVPIKYGWDLREQLGKPRTSFLLADHRTSILYTQFVPLLPPNRCFGLFPFDYIETEAMYFFEKSFEKPKINTRHLLFELVQVPFYVADGLIRAFF